MSHLWRNREERWSEALCLPTGLIDLSSAGDTPTRRSVTRDISRTARLRDKRRPYVPAKPVRCQTLVNTEDGEGEPCGRIATFIVKGRPGNPWWGFHCDPHALDVARHMGHQGGSVIVPIEDAR